MNPASKSGEFVTVMPGDQAKNRIRPLCHVVDDSHFEPRNGPAWVLCSCGARMERDHGHLMDRVFSQHRLAVGAPPLSATGWDREQWRRKQEAVPA